MFNSIVKWKLGQDLKLYWCVFISTMNTIYNSCRLYEFTLFEFFHEIQSPKLLGLGWYEKKRVHDNFPIKISIWLEHIWFIFVLQKSVQSSYIFSLLNLLRCKTCKKVHKEWAVSKLINRSRCMKIMCWISISNFCHNFFSSFWTGSMEILIHFFLNLS